MKTWLYHRLSNLLKAVFEPGQGSGEPEKMDPMQVCSPFGIRLNTWGKHWDSDLYNCGVQQ